MIWDLEILLAKSLGWSLKDIDDTDVGSMFDFVRRFGQTAKQNKEPQKKNMAYCDEVDFL